MKKKIPIVLKVSKNNDMKLNLFQVERNKNKKRIDAIKVKNILNKR